MSDAFTRGFESATRTPRRPTPTPVGGPSEDISALQVQLGDARKALWQRDLPTAARDVRWVLDSLNSRRHREGPPDLRTFEASAHSVFGQILAEGGGVSELARTALDRAVNVFGLVIGEGSRNAQAHADYGAALHLLGMDDRAYPVLCEARDLGDNSPYTARVLAGIMLDRGETDDARKLLESVNTAVPGDPRILSLLGRIDRESGDLVAARSHLHQAATAARQNGDLTRAAELFGQVIELAPEDADLHCGLGDVLLRLGKPFHEVLAAFDRALLLDHDHQRARIGKADALRVYGDFTQALLLLDEALTGPEPPADALALKGDVLRLLGRYDEALAVLDAAVERNPETAWIVGTRGQVRRVLGRHAEAEEDLVRAVLIDKRLVWAWAELAAARHSMGNHTAAVIAATEALKLDLNFPLALAVKAREEIFAGRDADAVVTLRHLCALAPDLSWVWTDLAEAYHRLDENARAFERATMAINRGIAEPGLRLLRAELVADTKQGGAADHVREDLAAYLSSESTDLAGLRRAGQAYRAIGDHDEASRVFGLALELDDDPEVRQEKAAAEFDGGRYEQVLDTLAGLSVTDACADDLFRRGVAARKLGGLKEAHHSFKLALDADSTHLPAMHELVALNLRQPGRVDRARRYAAMALELAPDKPAVLVDAADVELTTHQHEQALVHLRRAREQAPDDPDVLVTYAVALSETAGFAEAVRVLDHRAETSGEESPAGLLGFALENLAIGALSATRTTPTDEARALLERAHEVYRRGLERESENYFLRRGAADTTYALHGGTAAEGEYAALVTAMEEAPRYDGDGLGVLGWCYCRLGRYDEAIRTYVSALSADHGSADTLYVEFDLALATLASGRADLGRAEYERAWGHGRRFAGLWWHGLLQVARNDLVQTLLGGGFADRAAPEEIVARFDELLEKTR